MLPIRFNYLKRKHNQPSNRPVSLPAEPSPIDEGDRRAAPQPAAFQIPRENRVARRTQKKDAVEGAHPFVEENIAETVQNRVLETVALRAAEEYQRKELERLRKLNHEQSCKIAGQEAVVRVMNQLHRREIESVLEVHRKGKELYQKLGQHYSKLVDENKALRQQLREKEMATARTQQRGDDALIQYLLAVVGQRQKLEVRVKELEEELAKEKRRRLEAPVHEEEDEDDQ